jgi:adenosine deaminase
MNRIPLCDLHCHLDGSITVPIALELAQLQNISLPTTDYTELENLLSVPDTCKNLSDFLKCFNLPLSLMQTEEGISEAVRLVCENLKEQNLDYAEIRFAPQLHTEKGLSQVEVVKAALEGLKKTDFHANLILCMMRGENTHDANLETVEIAKNLLVRDGGIVAVDLAGDEAHFPLSDYQMEFSCAAAWNIPVTIHAGEAAGCDSVWDAVECGALRIGHGIRAIEDDELLDELIDEDIVLEICPTSNRITKAFPDMKKYPLVELIKRGVRVTINTDDMAICRTTLQDEYNYIQKEFGITDSQKYSLMQNAWDAAFCNLIKAQIIEDNEENIIPEDESQND